MSEIGKAAEFNKIDYSCLFFPHTLLQEGAFSTNSLHVVLGDDRFLLLWAFVPTDASVSQFPNSPM